MELSELKKKAEMLSENNLEYSSLLIWKEIISIKKSEYNLFCYAEQLRICGYFKKSETIYSGIDINNIPEKHHSLFYVFKGQLFLDMGDFSNAELLFRTAVNREPDSTESYVYLASLLMINEDYTYAEKTLLKALNKVGDRDEVYYNLSLCQIRLGNNQAALSSIDKCLELNPNYNNGIDLKKDILGLTQLA